MILFHSQSDNSATSEEVLNLGSLPGSSSEEEEAKSPNASSCNFSAGTVSQNTQYQTHFVDEGLAWTEDQESVNTFATPHSTDSNARNVSFPGARSSSGSRKPLRFLTVADPDDTEDTYSTHSCGRRLLFCADKNHRDGIIHTPVPSRFVAGRRRRNYTFRSRKKASPKVSKLKRTRLDESNRIINPFKQERSCCKRYECFGNIDPIHAFHWYREVKAMNREQYKATLFSWFNTVRKEFEFDGRTVCWEFLRKGFGFSNTIISTVAGTEKAPAAQTTFAQPRELRGRNLRNSIITFLRIISRTHGDVMPHKKFINLPFASRKVVYEKYVEYFYLHDEVRFSRSPPTIAYFYAVWREYVPDVKVLKNTGFAKCAECVYYDEEKARNILNPAALRQIAEASGQHHKDMALERQGYEQRKQLSCMDPQYYLSLVVDGADQSNYGLPHFVQKSKEDSGHKIEVKIVGVLIHGVENDLYLFSMVEGFETGANHIIESIHRALNLKKKKLRRLPPTLFVQVDNCTRENKNRYFLSYLEMLVARGVFVEIQMFSLEVGHTHTDVDQSFSCVRKRLDHHDAHSLNQLHQQLLQSYAPSPHVEELDRIANFSTQCERSKSLSKVSNYTQYRYFRLLRSSSQAKDGMYATKCSVKRYLSDDWLDLPKSNGRGFLKTIPNILSMSKTKTRVPPNVREVNSCLRPAEGRIRDESIMKELYSLRDRVYTSQKYEEDWTSDNSFEVEADYAPEAPRRDIESLSRSGQPQGGTQRFKYSIDDFVAVKPERTYKTPFWVAEVLGFSHVDNQGYPRTLQVRWYTARNGQDPFMVTYKPGFTGSTPWIAEIHVDTVMLRFDKLTRRNRLSRETATKLSRSLGTGE